MGELLDRDFQRHLLQMAYNTYPNDVMIEDSLGKPAYTGQVAVNISYLAEHQLLEVFRTSVTRGFPSTDWANRAVSDNR
jgi:hypothetical protein